MRGDPTPGSLEAPADRRHESPTRTPGELPWPTFLVIVAVIGVLGVVLRAHYVLTNSLWTDEMTSLHQITIPWREFARWYEAPDPHPPLYYLSLRVFRSVTGGAASETAIRLAGTAWFLLVPAALIVYGRRDSRRRLPALTVLVLVAATPSFVYLGAELRMYGMLMALLLVMTLVAVDWLEHDRARIAHVAGFAVLGVAASLTHYTGALVALAIGGTILGVRLLRDCRVDWAVLASGVGAVVLLSPISGTLRDQFDYISRTLYSTPAREALGFLAWGTGAVGLVVVATAVGVVARESLARGKDREGVAAVQAPSFLVPTVTVGLLAGGFAFSALLLDIDLHNFGISIVPAMLVVFGLASIAALMPRLLTVGLIIGAVAAVGLTLVTNRDSAVFEANRVPTVDTLHDALAATGLDAESDELTIVHIDWDRSNAYFADSVSDRHPGATVSLIPIREYETLGRLLDFQLGTRKTVLIVTRLPLETRILPQIPPGGEVTVLDDNAVVVRRGP